MPDPQDMPAGARGTPVGDAPAEREAELLGFAIGPLEEMEAAGAYWADEADAEEKITPRMVIDAVERAIARATPHDGSPTPAGPTEGSATFYTLAEAREKIADDLWSVGAHWSATWLRTGSAQSSAESVPAASPVAASPAVEGETDWRAIRFEDGNPHDSHRWEATEVPRRGKVTTAAVCGGCGVDIEADEALEPCRSSVGGERSRCPECFHDAHDAPCDEIVEASHDCGDGTSVEWDEPCGCEHRRHPPDSQPGTPHDSPEPGERERVLSLAESIANATIYPDDTEFMPSAGSHFRASNFIDYARQTAALIAQALRSPTEPERPETLRLLEELHALVIGESPGLLNEDSGGDANLDLAIREVLARARPTEEPGE